MDQQDAQDVGAEAESDGAAEGVQPSEDEAVRVGGSAADGVEAQPESKEVAEEAEEASDGES